MGLKASPEQYHVLAGFCNDVGKGVMLAAIVGQGAVEGVPLAARVYLAVFWVFSALLLLYLAVVFSQYVHN